MPYTICDEHGKPVGFDLDEDVMSCLGYSPGQHIAVFSLQSEAEDVMNALPATSFFEGAEDYTVKRVTLTVGETMAEMSTADEDEDDEDEEEEDEDDD